MTRARFARLLALAVMLVAGAVAASPAPAVENAYTVHPLVSDGSVPAPTIDPHLVNAWGLTASATSPWWVADNGTDLSTLYNAAGTPLALVVSVPGAPTGAVFNSTAVFVVKNGDLSGPARFLFDTESGTILGWNPAVSVTTAVVAVDRSNLGAIYKGLTLATATGGPRLYAADFHNARIDVFDGTFALVTEPGAFVDPALPSGYAPFNVQAIGSRIFVSYAKQDAAGEDEIAGHGLGFVDAYDADGHLLARVAQHGQLNAPWGLALAPADFGGFSGDLLVGNFGDGRINAYEEQADGSFERVGGLRGADGRAIAIDGLWALQFGHGAPNNGPTNTLFFTAGPNDEAGGLFGSITAG